MSAVPKDLVAASASPMLLAILCQSDNYGYAIIKQVRKLSGGQLAWTEGMLYPILHRLEEQGHIEAYWQGNEGGRQRKYYRISPGGREHLRELRAQWENVNHSLEALWPRTTGGKEDV